jgi:hypothetical protein
MRGKGRQSNPPRRIAWGATKSSGECATQGKYKARGDACMKGGGNAGFWRGKAGIVRSLKDRGQSGGRAARFPVMLRVFLLRRDLGSLA